MPNRTKRKRRRNPYAGLLHLLNRRYHDEFVRAELLQNDLGGMTSSRVIRIADRLRWLVRKFIPHPSSIKPHMLAEAEPYRGPALPVPDASVSIVIPFRDRPELLGNCLRSLRLSTFRNVEIVLVDNGSERPATGRLLARIGAKRAVKLVSRPGRFNFSLLCNAGAAAASGDHLVFLNNDTEVLSDRWLERMLSLAADPAVGVVGATLLYPDRTVQHAGMLPRSDGMWIHPHRGAPVESLPPEVQSVPAVTAACLMIRRDLFDTIGGFDESLPVTLNDVDLCRRVRDRGKLVVVTPKARLLHYEGLTRGCTIDPPET